MSKINRLVSVAPMMDCTDRHERYFLRLISKHVLLYTEMVVSEAIDRGDKDKLLSFDLREKPVALQLGGSTPKLLANAAKIGEPNPLIGALTALGNIQQQLARTSLLEPEFPFIENPLLPITQDTPATPQTLNLPSIDANIVNNPGAAGSFSNLTTAQKLQILFPQG